MAPAAQRKQADMSLDLNPMFGPQKPTAVLRVFDIMVGVMFFHLPDGFVKQASGVEGGNPWGIRWITRRSRSALGNNSGYLDAMCPMFFPLMPLF